jgi:heat-inducible transcriptional repressor
LKYPELGDREKAAKLLETFEEKSQLTELIQDLSNQEEGKEHGIQVYIGEEAPLSSMQNCSMVTATYEIEEGVYGRIGIVGPKRMDYEKVVSTLHTLMTELDDIFKRKS